MAELKHNYPGQRPCSDSTKGSFGEHTSVAPGPKSSPSSGKPATVCLNGSLPHRPAHDHPLGESKSQAIQRFTRKNPSAKSREIAALVGCRDAYVRTVWGRSKVRPCQPRASRPWTPEQIETLKRLRVDKTLSQISAIMGRSVSSISKIACKLGLEKKARGQCGSWTPERVEKLRELWPRLTTNQIACRLDISPSSVAGKAHRLRLPTKLYISRRYYPRAMSPHGPRQAWGSISYAVIPPASPVPPTPPGERIALLELEPHHCRFILSDGGPYDKRYCGQKVVTGASYCGFHYAVCWQPALRRQGVSGVFFSLKQLRPFNVKAALAPGATDEVADGLLEIAEKRGAS